MSDEHSRVVVHEGRAMGSDLRIVAVGPRTTDPVDGVDGIVERACHRVAHLESLWSRFLPDSDISRLAQESGRPVQVHRDTVTLVVAMVQAWHATDGCFDPTLRGVLESIGYPSGASFDVASRRGRPDLVRVDQEAGVVVVPHGSALDAGGLGKGLAADLVAEEMLVGGAEGALVSIGGDLRAVGRPPRGHGGWIVDVDGPDGRPPDRLAVAEGGVATSGTDRRRWLHDGQEMHHLIDPFTGGPATGPARGATVVAGTAAWSEAWTKVLMLLGAEEAMARLDAHGVAGRVVDTDGVVRCNRAWSAFAVDTVMAPDRSFGPEVRR